MASFPQNLLCDGHIIERYHPFADSLCFFVSFAGEQYQVTRACLSNGQFDRVTTVWLDDHGREWFRSTREAPRR